MCVRKDSTENLWLPLKLTTSESITVSLEWILLVRLISRSVNFSFLFFFFWIRVWKWWLSRVPGDVPSMECIQQQQDGTDANNTTQDEGVTPLPKVDSLDEAVHSRKTIFGKSLLRSYVEEASLKSHRNHKKQRSVESRKTNDEKKQRGRKAHWGSCSKHQCLTAQRPKRIWAPRHTAAHGWEQQKGTHWDRSRQQGRLLPCAKGGLSGWSQRSQERRSPAGQAGRGTASRHTTLHSLLFLSLSLKSLSSGDWEVLPEGFWGVQDLPTGW